MHYNCLNHDILVLSLIAEAYKKSPEIEGIKQRIYLLDEAIRLINRLERKIDWTDPKNDSLSAGISKLKKALSQFDKNLKV